MFEYGNLDSVSLLLYGYNVYCFLLGKKTNFYIFAISRKIVRSLILQTSKMIEADHGCVPSICKPLAIKYEYPHGAEWNIFPDHLIIEFPNSITTLQLFRHFRFIEISRDKVSFVTNPPLETLFDRVISRFSRPSLFKSFRFNLIIERSKTKDT